jgi:hypothetical protein
MPVIEVVDIDLDIALANIIASVSLEEAALAHILNAEGEKIQYALGTLKYPTGHWSATQTVNPTAFDPSYILDINKVVDCMVWDVSQIECSLMEKLLLAINALRIESNLDPITFDPCQLSCSCPEKERPSRHACLDD